MNSTPVAVKPLHISRSMLGAILLCFFLPFVTVSCGPITATLSGFTFISGGTPTVSDGRQSRPADEPVPRQPLLVISYLLTMAGLGVSFVKQIKQRVLFWLLASVGIISALALLLFQTVMEGQARQNGFALTFNFGFWLTVVLYVALAGFHIWLALGGKFPSSVALPLPAAVGSSAIAAPMAAVMSGAGVAATRTCPSCGNGVNPDAHFCMHCGATLDGSAAPTAQAADAPAPRAAPQTIRFEE
ncbi:MAG: zinc ribbon domain-containing protein [Chloroflexaceae bacterium]|nr:zinc ribbon domain-containing protein [Chloroflexaceae bacterium]